MKEVNFHKPRAMNSLSIKFALLVFMLTVVASAAIAYAVLMLQQDVLFEQEKQELKRQSEKYARELDAGFLAREKKAISANSIVARYLANSVTSSSPLPATQPDGSVRMQDDLSAAFIPVSKLDPQQTAWFAESQELWQQLAPLMLEEFFNFYFISKQGLIRIAPADWALEVPVTHDFTKDVFFDIATPQQNPGRLPRWTPIYYDAIWQKWMTSLVIPLYVADEFIGVTGSDYILDELFLDLTSIEESSAGLRSLLFDVQGNLLLDGKKTMSLQKSGQQNFDARYSFAEPRRPELAAYIQQVTQKSADDQLLQADLANYLLSTAKIKRLDWYLTLYQDKQVVVGGLQDFRDKVMLIFLAVAVVVALSLQFFIYQFILKRLTRLSSAVQRISKGDVQQITLDQNDDEIGMLNRAFNGMAGEIHQLISGLNARIGEKEEAERATRKLTKAVAFSSSGILLTDKELKIEYLNPFMLELMGCTSDQMMQKPLSSLFAAEMFFVGEEICQTLQERHHWRGDMLLQHALRKLWVSLAIAPIRDEKGDISNYVCAMQDISFIKESQRKMEQLAYYDMLTGLANRSYFRDQLRKAIAMSSRGYYHFALLYFDLDEFKRINDTLGHDAGDELLKEVARRLISRLREEDTIARLGGDEFAVILSGIKDRTQAALIAENLQQSFAAPVKLTGQEVAISASIGITIAPEDAADEELLLKHADLAMYEAKARGRNTYHFFSQDLNDAAKEKLQIENHLREAIREHQFVLYYQPKIDIRTNVVIGYEALLRWIRPDGSMIPPLRFIPVAESTGLIVEIGEWIIWEACRFISRQQSRGHDVTISINLSARQFTDQNLAEVVERVLQRTGAKPDKLIFEITESMLMGDTDAAIAQLNELKRLGVTLSIDDFGTGYSSLSYLKRFPVDELKIDRSFVKDIPADTNDMDIVAAIIAMAQKMNLRVVAEGVETIEQIEFLKNNACYLVQGYYFSMPRAEQDLYNLSYQPLLIGAASL
ncbi:EAL domain-containing protein [Rheinheimera sediminis]|uniref:EAL domain-containing protein n=1 Tax=Rheinheimera sp. YQF-1 TaxID=2499626 RepID=UPI000FD8A198|nr:EAL domain-containing protein [Rheinheimera sp. YQF-1]RVT44182.1 EAL domain-containing protein [Rheinheimera sp. YQF-1]